MNLLVSSVGDLLDHGASLKTGPFGTMLKAHQYSVEGVPLVSVGEIGDGDVLIGERTPRIGPDVVRALPEYLLEAGDIVFARKGSVDRVALVKDHESGYFLGSDGLRLRLGGTANPRFVAASLHQPWIKDWLLQHAGGSTLKSLNQETIKRIPLVLPDRPTQDAIAEVLGALDDKIAVNSRVVSGCVNLASALFDDARPVDTVTTTYSAIAEVSGGGTPSTQVPEYWEGAIPWVTPTDVTALNGPYLDVTGRSITRLGLQNCASGLYPEGSILMTSRATIGAFALAKTDVAVNQGFIVVQAKDPSHQLWLFHEMQSRVGDYISHSNGATFLELSRGRFKAMQLERPSDDGVMRRFAELAAPMHDRAYQAMVESRHLAQLRDALLPHLMSGRITVRQAELLVDASG